MLQPTRFDVEASLAAAEAAVPDDYWLAAAAALERINYEWRPEHDELAACGLAVCSGNGDAGRSLAVAAGRGFGRGDELLRELPAACVLFDEPWSELERGLAARFSLSKLAPPYRLLARCLECHGELLADGHIIMGMAANMETATGRWPSAFVSALVDAANAALPSSGASPFSLAAASRLFAIIKTNAFGIYDVGVAGLQNVGLGLYRLAGLANHECDPSAVWAFDLGARQIVLRATRPLVAHDAVSISYVLSREPPAARQHKLRELYKFKCACARCGREATREARLTEHAAAFRTARSALAESAANVGSAAGARDHARVEEGVAKCAELLEELTPTGDCHPEAAVCWLAVGRAWRDVAARRGGGRDAASCVERATECGRRARGMLQVSLGPHHAILAQLDNEAEAWAVPAAPASAPTRTAGAKPRRSRTAAR